MRRKRYKNGHLSMLALESSILTYEDIIRRVKPRFFRSKPAKPKPRPCDLASKHVISINSSVNLSGTRIVGSFCISLKRTELPRFGVTLKQLINNYKKSVEVGLETLCSVSIDKVGGTYTKIPEADSIMLWANISAPLSKCANHLHGYSLESVLSERDMDRESLLTYLQAHYVLTNMLMEYPGYTLTGKVS